MKEYDATEQAYWNGYRKAVETFEKSQKTEANSIEKSEAEIMKTLAYCQNQGLTNECTECSYRMKRDCMGDLLEDALDLINRKNAENERLKDKYSIIYAPKGRIQDEARAEAIKEVYTRLSMNFGTYTDNDSVKLVDLFRLFDQIAKEMGVE